MIHKLASAWSVEDFQPADTSYTPEYLLISVNLLVIYWLRFSGQSKTCSAAEFLQINANYIQDTIWLHHSVAAELTYDFLALKLTLKNNLVIVINCTLHLDN